MKFLKKHIRTGIALICACLALSLYTSFYLNNPRYTHTPRVLSYTEKANIKDIEIYIDRATTFDEQTKGLSGQQHIEDSQGLLFTFDVPSKNGIWMKDMLFSIDVLWLDQDMKIVHIKKNFEPSSYPMSETPDVASKYVLELQGGFVDKYGIELGDTLTFPQ